MATCTPIYQLPVPTGDDRPCDIDDWSCAFAEAVETQLDALDAVVNRTTTTIPMAQVVMTEPLSFTEQVGSVTNFVFDTVLADTDNMFDAAEPDRILVNTAGLYSLTARVYGDAVGTNFASLSLRFRLNRDGVASTLFTEQRGWTNVAGGINFYMTPSAVSSFVDGDFITLTYNFNSTSGETLTFRRVQLGATWLGDVP